MFIPELHEPYLRAAIWLHATGVLSACLEVLQPAITVLSWTLFDAYMLTFITMYSSHTIVQFCPIILRNHVVN